MSRQTTKDRKAAKATAAAEAFIDSKVTETIKRNRQRIIECTAEDIVRERDERGLSWAQVAANLNLGSPSGARSAYTKLTGRPHNESQPLLTRSSKNLLGKHTKANSVQWDDDTDQDDIIAAITHHRIVVRRKVGELELPDEMVHVSRIERFEYGNGGFGELQVVLYTKDACECQVKDPRDADYGTARSFRVRDIVEVR